MVSRLMLNLHELADASLYSTTGLQLTDMHWNPIGHLAERDLIGGSLRSQLPRDELTFA